MTAQTTKTDILRRLFANESIVLPATTGEVMIGTARDVFTGGIDPNFKNWNLNVVGQARPETKVAVYEMTRDATPQQMFDGFGIPLDQFCLTQDQIVKFCITHHDRLHTEGHCTFFPFKEKEAFFVADVYVDDGLLEACVFLLAYGDVWHAESRRRVVVRQ